MKPTKHPPIKVDPCDPTVGDGLIVYHGKRAGRQQRRSGVKGRSPWERAQLRQQGVLPSLPNEHIRNNRQKHSLVDARKDPR